MKHLVFTLLLLAAALLSGCESDMPPEKNRENPIQRGIKGEGTLVQPDQSDDPFIR
jgi:outer membrane biogenesis lipoprotein LolB